MEKQKTEGIQLPNGWESVSVIGKGSFGVVYKAKRVIGRNTEWAAVKHISMPADPDDLNQIRAELGTANEDTINAYLYESLQDMLGEYFQMKSLQGNTNIVACHDIQQIPKADEIGYDVFIWMELLDSLSKRTIDGKMNREEVVRMGLDICQALSLLCSKGIVHRDIKPQNIFVNERGDYKLGDFGSARGIKGTSTILTMKGTFSYMAPEIMQGRPANFTSDIYSLGLVMYRLLNRNRHPFMQEGEVSSARVIEESNYRRLGGEALPMPVDADEELGRIILKACAYEPRNRWQTPEEMYNALAALGEETVKRVFAFDRPPVTDQPNKEQEIKTVTASTITPQEESTSKTVEKPPQPTLEEKASVPPVYMAPKSDANEKKTDQNKKSKKTGIVISVAAICVLLVVAAVFALKNWDKVGVILDYDENTIVIDISTHGNSAHTVALKKDGTVIACGNNDFGQCNVQDWTDIVSISAGGCHTIGVKKDGTVIACGNNDFGQCNVQDWTDVKSVSCGPCYTLGLKKDGSVVACGENSSGEGNVSDWHDIISISAGLQHSVGLKSDGTVIACGFDDERLHVQNWSDIVSVSAGTCTMGLRKNGKVFVVGASYFVDQLDVTGWSDIIAITAGNDHIVGLKRDGTVVATGNNADGQCNVESWTDIIGISAGTGYTIALKKDGTVITCGNNDYGQCNVQDWTVTTGLYDPNRNLNAAETNATYLGIAAGSSEETEFALGSVLANILNREYPDFLSVDLFGGDISVDDNDVERMELITQTEYMMGIAQSDIVYSAFHGSRCFSMHGYMPNVRILAGLYAEPLQIVTIDPEIKSVADLKGKKVGVGHINTSGTYFNARDIFSAYSIDIEKDVEPIYQSFAASVKSLKNGEIDAAFLCADIPASPVLNLCTSMPVYLVPIDNEHAEKILADYPFYTKYLITKDVYDTSDDCPTLAVKATLVADASISDDVAYAIVKTIFENKEKIAAAHAKGAELDLAFAVDGAIPFHPGAIKYYEEKGVEVLSP